MIDASCLPTTTTTISLTMPTSFYYPIVTQQDVRRTIEGFEPYLEECRVPLPDLTSSNDNKNLRRLNRYWREVDQFVKEQFAGWKERSSQLERMQGGSEGGRKRGREETSESEGGSPKKKRTVSDYFVIEFVTEVRTRVFRASIQTSTTFPVEVRSATSVSTRAGSVSRVRMVVQMALVPLVRRSTPPVGPTE